MFRTSIFLTIIALLAHFSYGFSTQSAGNLVRWRRNTALSRPSTAPLIPRGGAFGKKSMSKVKQTTSPIDTGSKCPATGAAAIFGSVWGTGGVLYILLKAIKRVLPIAMEPFQAGAVPLSQFELG